MRVGLITEGLGDQEVIISVLKGATGIHRCNVAPLRPEQSNDRTDRCAGPRHTMTPEEYGNYALVKHECENREKIRDFFDYIDEERFIVVHIDGAEAADFGVTKPPKDPNALDEYVKELSRRVVHTIVGWLQDEYVDRIRFAVAVEETEAWLLAHWDQYGANDTSKHERPKERLKHLLNTDACGMSKDARRQLMRLCEQDLGRELSNPLGKRRTLIEAMGKSRSLQHFVDQLPRPANDD